MRPRLLDLYSGAGGAAAGYHRAGFDVVGVDNVHQPRYPFAFVQADALEYLAAHGGEYDAIHASPPCQRYAPVTRWRGAAANHPDLLPETLRQICAAGRSWVVENVPGSPLRPDFTLCGSMFGLRVRRHRLFCTSWTPGALLPPCEHRLSDYCFDHGGKQTETTYRDAMGCEWMTVAESRNALPPAYCEWIGRQLLAALERTVT